MNIRHLVTTSLILGLVAAAACSDPTPTKADADLVPAAGSSGASSAACPTGRGPSMVLVALPGAPAFCIDSTEVTQGQYIVFANDPAVDLAKQSREECRTYNHELIPPVAQHQVQGCPAGEFDPANKPDVPVSCVDWCDADAFCAWAGKRLCGGVGGAKLTTGEDAVGPTSEWYLACSQGGKTKYPYGDDFQPGTCDTGEKYNPTPANTRACQGDSPPFDAIRDLSGSVSEWVDACGPDLASCGVLGGTGSTEYPATLACSSPAAAPGLPQQGAINPSFGFRCCADPGKK